MELPFLDRLREADRMARFFQRHEGSLAVLYGRRRCGKSRLLMETLPRGFSVYFVADEREAPLQRVALATEIGRQLAGFDRVAYPDWDALLDRWWREAPRGAVLALDEFQSMVASAPELPSILQKHLDRQKASARHIVLCGSSQRMMQGLALRRGEPLFGRAAVIMEIDPLPAGWIADGLGLAEPIAAVESYATWGGVPRYWELAAEFTNRVDAVRDLVLDPLGVLHREPDLLLVDDLRDVAQSSSILQLIGMGCRRLSEIAGRLGKPATSLGRPIQRLLDLGLIRRVRPFGTSERDTKRSLYRLADPFLSFWFRFVAPNRSRLEARAIDVVERDLERDFSGLVGQVWEDMARDSVARANLLDVAWNPAAAWWGAGRDHRPLEVDVVAESVDGKSILLGSVKWEEETDLDRVEHELLAASRRLPFIDDRKVHHAVWVKRSGSGKRVRKTVIGPHQVLALLR